MCYDLFLPVFFNMIPLCGKLEHYLIQVRGARTRPSQPSVAKPGNLRTPCSVIFSRSRRPRVRRVVVRSTTSGLQQWALRVQEPGLNRAKGQWPQAHPCHTVAGLLARTPGAAVLPPLGSGECRCLTSDPRGGRHPTLRVANVRLLRHLGSHLHSLRLSEAPNDEAALTMRRSARRGRAHFNTPFGCQPNIRVVVYSV